MTKRTLIYTISIIFATILVYLLFTNNLRITKNHPAISLGGEWFLNNQNDNFLHYEYTPATNEHTASSHALRELAALWSVTQLTDFTGDARYDRLAQKGIDYFADYIAYDNANNFAYLNLTPDKIKLGYSAFMILSLIESDYPDKNELLSQFADGIIAQQRTDGSLKTFFYSDQDSGIDYYPGEALLALMTLYEYTHDDKYLTVVENALPYYQEYWNQNPNTAFAPWQSRAYYKLYRQNPRPEIAEYIFSMNDFVLSSYHPGQECSEFVFNQGIVAAVHIEGVIQAYALAGQTGDTERYRCYQNYIKEGIDYVLSLQEPAETDLAAPAIGGFWDGAGHKSMRVDRNQHAVMMLIDAYNQNLL